MIRGKNVIFFAAPLFAVVVFFVVTDFLAAVTFFVGEAL
jgi:hypothetical protein